MCRLDRTELMALRHLQFNKKAANQGDKKTYFMPNPSAYISVLFTLRLNFTYRNRVLIVGSCIAPGVACVALGWHVFLFPTDESKTKIAIAKWEDICNDQTKFDRYNWLCRVDINRG